MIVTRPCALSDEYISELHPDFPSR